MAVPRILFVDDEPNVLAALKRNLRRHEGEWAMSFRPSPREALAAQSRQPFDVLVTDMRMPEMSGLELIKCVRETGAATACIILTGAGDLELAMAAINEAQVFRFYTKPAATERLVAGIREALDRPGPKPEADKPGASDLGVAALDRLPWCVLVLDADCKVVFMNAGGARLAAARDGIVLSPSGICRAMDVAPTKDLHALVRATIERGEANAMALPRPSSMRPLSVVSAPVAANAAVLILTDPERHAFPSAAMVASLFDLTASEARLALAVVREPSLEEAAAQVGVTVATARSYLKRIFMKAGVSRQAELVRLILTAPVTAGGVD